MFFKALLATLALPVTIGVLMPLGISFVDPWKIEGAAIGIGLMVPGTVVMGLCIRDFYVSGKGTLAPWHPPQNLVSIGLYRYTRNPMYIGVLIIIAGIGLALGSLLVLAYGTVAAAGFHLRVVLYEEPWMAERFGDEWQVYRHQVDRWWPSLKAGKDRR